MAKTNTFKFDWDNFVCYKNKEKFGDIVAHDHEKMQVMVTNKKSKAFGEIMTFIIVKQDENESI